MSRFRFYSMLTAPVTFVFVAQLYSAGRRTAPPGWVDHAPWIFAGALIYVLGTLAYLHRDFARRISNRLRTQGKDPDRWMVLVGVALLMTPAAVGLFLASNGAPMTYMYISAVVSIVGMFYWGRLYSHAIGPKRPNPEA